MALSDGLITSLSDWKEFPIVDTVGKRIADLGAVSQPIVYADERRVLLGLSAPGKPTVLEYVSADSAEEIGLRFIAAARIARGEKV